MLGQGNDCSLQKDQDLLRSCNFILALQWFLDVDLRLLPLPPQRPNGAMYIVTFLSSSNPTSDCQLCRPLKVVGATTQNGSDLAVRAFASLPAAKLMLRKLFHVRTRRSGSLGVSSSCGTKDF